MVIADAPADFAAGQLTALYSYESTFNVRQVDGYAFPTTTTGQIDVSGGALDGTTGTLTAAGLAAFPELKGPVPFDTGTYGYWSTVTAGAPFTPLITNAAGQVLAGVYQHPSTDPQAGVSELALNFDYNASQLQWLLLAPGLINWVTQGTHLGLYRNYFGQDIDDNFIADNEWSSTFQCTPAATNPPDYTCPPADQGIAQGTGCRAAGPVQMSAADVAYVANWEQQTGIKLNLAFNAHRRVHRPDGGGPSPARTAPAASPTAAAPSPIPARWWTPATRTIRGWSTRCSPTRPTSTGSPTPGRTCSWAATVWQPQALTSVTANGSGGTFAAGSYSYEITAATAYGESEPSAAQSVTVAANGSVTLAWPEASNGTGTDGTPGPPLAQLESKFSGGTGSVGLQHLPGEPRARPATGWSARWPRTRRPPPRPPIASPTPRRPRAGRPGRVPTFPSATNPGIDCSSAAGSWVPATSTTADCFHRAGDRPGPGFRGGQRSCPTTPRPRW